MLRIASLAFALLLTFSVPAAAALAPPASATTIAVGPDGLVDPNEKPYYLAADVSRPEAPRDGEKSDDCSAQRHPGPTQAAQGLVGPIREWNPVEDFRVSGWFPKCAASQVSPCPTPAGTCPIEGGGPYAAYDVTTGRYYIETDTPALVAGPGTGFVLRSPLVPANAATTSTTGTTGLALKADCEACPPPTGV